MIRSIIEHTGVKIDVEDSGKVNVASNDEASAAKALQIIGDLTATAEVGKTYLGTVTRLAEFGAFVEIIPGTDGLLHISEVAEHRIKDVRDELKEGDQVLVKVLAVEGNRIRLSRKAILKEQRAKMGGGELPPENGGGESGGGEPAHAPALTIEGGADFADDEPNFNRDAPVAGGGELTAARNAAEIEAPIAAETVVETADVAPAAEAVAEDVDAAAQAAVAVAVSAAADTAEAVTKTEKMEDGRPARPAKRPRNHRGLFFCAAHVGAGAPPAQPSKARPSSGGTGSIMKGTKRKKQVPPLPSWFASKSTGSVGMTASKLPCHPE